MVVICEAFHPSIRPSHHPFIHLFNLPSISSWYVYPNKLCDQVSNAVLDACLEQDPDNKVAYETCIKTNMEMLISPGGRSSFLECWPFLKCKVFIKVNRWNLSKTSDKPFPLHSSPFCFQICCYHYITFIVLFSVRMLSYIRKTIVWVRDQVQVDLDITFRQPLC